MAPSNRTGRESNGSIEWLKEKTPSWSRLQRDREDAGRAAAERDYDCRTGGSRKYGFSAPVTPNNVREAGIRAQSGLKLLRDRCEWPSPGSGPAMWPEPEEAGGFARSATIERQSLAENYARQRKPQLIRSTQASSGPNWLGTCGFYWKSPPLRPLGSYR